MVNQFLNVALKDVFDKGHIASAPGAETTSLPGKEAFVRV